MFHYGIQWKTGILAGYEKPTGYIVQHVMIEAPDYLTGFEYKEYYEAWLVKKGIIILPIYDGKEDDIFAYAPDGFNHFLFRKDSLFIDAEVAWVDASSLNYREIDEWKPGAIKQARDLKSSVKFHDFFKYKKYKRNTYSFNYDFCDSNNIKKALIKRGRNMYSSYREYDRLNYINNYSEYFMKEGKISLWEQNTKMMPIHING